jgi:hypothetical protein
MNKRQRLAYQSNLNALRMGYVQRSPPAKLQDMPPPRPPSRPAPIVEEGVDYASQASFLRREAETHPDGAQRSYLIEMAERFTELAELAGQRG